VEVIGRNNVTTTGQPAGPVVMLVGLGCGESVLRFQAEELKVDEQVGGDVHGRQSGLVAWVGVERQVRVCDAGGLVGALAVFDHGVLAVEGSREVDVVGAGHGASEVVDVRDDQPVAPAGGLFELGALLRISARGLDPSSDVAQCVGPAGAPP
jgi:hypothetical protein